MFAEGEGDTSPPDRLQRTRYMWLVTTFGGRDLVEAEQSLQALLDGYEFVSKKMAFRVHLHFKKLKSLSKAKSYIACCIKLNNYGTLIFIIFIKTKIS